MSLQGPRLVQALVGSMTTDELASIVMTLDAVVVNVVGSMVTCSPLATVPPPPGAGAGRRFRAIPGSGPIGADITVDTNRFRPPSSSRADWLKNGDGAAASGRSIWGADAGRASPSPRHPELVEGGRRDRVEGTERWPPPSGGAAGSPAPSIGDQSRPPAPSSPAPSLRSGQVFSRMEKGTRAAVRSSARTSTRKTRLPRECRPV